MSDNVDRSENDAIAGGRGDTPDNIPGLPERRKLHFGRGNPLPLYLQSESSECGLACLAMIASYYGHHENLAALRRRFSTSLKGTTLAQLVEIAQALGLACRPLRLELEELPQLATPCILHWDLDHFVVLRSITKRAVTIHDPAVGEVTLSLAEVGRHFTGVAVELTKGPTFQRKQPPPPISLRALAGSIHGLGRALVTIFGLALVLEVFTLVAPQFLQITIDQVLADGDHDLLGIVGISFVLLLIFQTVVSALRTWTVMWLGTNFTLNWTGNVFQHLLKLPQSYFIKRHLGDVVSRFGAIATIQQTLTTQFVSVILDGLMGTLTLVVMLIYSPLLTTLTVVALGIYAILRALYFRVYRESNLSQIIVTAKQQSRFIEAVRGVQTLRLFNQGPAQTARYLNVTTDALNTSIAVQKLNLIFGSLNGLASGAQRIGVLWLGAWLALKGEMSAGMLMAFVAYADQFTSRAGSLVDYIIQLRLLRLQGERLADIVMTPPESHTEGRYVGPRPAPSVRFDNVAFRYADGEPWVIKDCSFEIQAGEFVAVTGASGCGKSTLAKLMLGLLDPQIGTISIGGVDVKHLGKNAYRAMTGSVMQDDILFAGSIAENISFYDETATPQRIEQAARLAQLHDDIVGMPMGYHTLVGDMGSALSGGQRQRLYLARALYRQPSLLLLDEATSQLDAKCEDRINCALGALSMTRIAIAHRKETIDAADRILVCVAGKVISAKAVRDNTATPMEGETYEQSIS